MPVGADALTEKGFRDWVASVHPVFVETKLADLLIEMGYDRVAVIGAIDEDMLRESFGVKRGHATLFVLAARALQKSLGVRTSSETGSMVTTSHVMHATKRRTQAPKVPLAGSSSGCGVAGLGTVASIRAWMLQLCPPSSERVSPDFPLVVHHCALLLKSFLIETVALMVQ